ncbi:hypothetical protein D3C85_1708840 [compost metagenome]
MPSAAISGRSRNILPVTSNSCSMMGAGPFSLARRRDSCQPVMASSWETCSVKATEAAEPYFICSMVRVEPRPRKPMP